MIQPFLSYLNNSQRCKFTLVLEDLVDFLALGYKAAHRLLSTMVKYCVLQDLEQLFDKIMQEISYDPKHAKVETTKLMQQKPRKTTVPCKIPLPNNTIISNNPCNALQDLKEDVGIQEKQSKSKLEKQESQ